MNRLFITSTGTDIGKTLVTAALGYQLKLRGERVSAIKPVVCGFSSPTSDPALLLQAVGLEATSENISCVAPWYFREPVSPHIAASREGRDIRLREVAAFCRQPWQLDWLLIEGVGGVMSPLAADCTNIDLISELNCPAVLVAGTYLGALSHTLTALECLQRRSVNIAGVVVSESSESGMELEDMQQAVKQFAQEPLQVITIPRVQPRESLYQELPSLLGLCNESH